MAELDLPLLLEPDALEPLLGTDGMVVIDLSKPETHAQYHIPGAVFMDYSQLVTAQPPAMGLLPDAAELAALFGAAGIGNETHVVAYDDEGGGKAGRLLWTLEALGHTRFSLLNGGLHAWAGEGYSLVDDTASPPPAAFTPRYNENAVADAAFIKERLGSGLALLDARSAEEYAGLRLMARRGGHIPGAVNLDWVRLQDLDRNLRLKPAAELEKMLEALAITPDREVVVYCQTHHRSSLSYVALKSLGFEKVRGYPGSWSDWGNRDDTPVEED